MAAGRRDPPCEEHQGAQGGADDEDLGDTSVMMLMMMIVRH